MVQRYFDNLIEKKGIVKEINNNILGPEAFRNRFKNINKSNNNNTNNKENEQQTNQTSATNPTTPTNPTNQTLLGKTIKSPGTNDFSDEGSYKEIIVIDDPNVAKIIRPVTLPTNENKKCEEKKRELIDLTKAEENVAELTVVPRDLQEVLPRGNQVWNCDKIGVDPNGKWNKIVCTYKWCGVEKLWKTQEGEKAPFWVSFLFFSRADGQCFIPPTIVHQGTELSGDMQHGLPDDWILHSSPSGYMDRDGWFKTIDNFSKLSGASEGNPQFLFFVGHDSHWDSDALDLLPK